MSNELRLSRGDESKGFHLKTDKIMDAFVVIGMAGGSTILTGIVLETFLKIPITQVTTHVVAAVSSAIVGTG